MLESLIEGLPRILWLCCAASPAWQPEVMALAGAGTQSSSGHKPELDKLYCWHLEFLSSLSFLFSSSSSSFFPPFLIEGWLTRYSIHHRKSVSQLNIDICFLVPVLALHILPHMISCPPLLLAWPHAEPLYGFTGICTRRVIIIMETVTGNLSHITDTLCLIMPSSAVALTEQTVH